MKKIILKSLFAIAILISITSCATVHSGSMTSSASLSSANFSYVKQDIKGTASVQYVFGIGGNAKETLVNVAKQQMLASNPLKTNQALANLTVNFKRNGLLFSKVTCIVTADVVEFK